MNGLCQASLLAAFAGSGYAAFACLAGVSAGREGLTRLGRRVGVGAVLALTLSLGVLIWALASRDYGFAYVRQYTSRGLPWNYRLASLWVGQAGSLLLWAWMLGVLAVGVLKTGSDEPRVTDRAFGWLMGYVCFLAGTMVFAANPMERSLVRGGEGMGLSPLLQHPAMMIHPPVVFLAYAGWAVPCALVLAALEEGGLGPKVLGRMRAWGLASWALLGVGILLGAQWSYEELGWGGYWAWDPVENASLVPWLTGTALLHTLMASRARGVLRKTTAGLAIGTFGLCNLATFLTRSGIFSSLHAFSRSPIGWLFLGMMAVLAAGGGWLIARRRGLLRAERSMPSVVGCEAVVVVSAAALVGLAVLVTEGTVFVAGSEWLVGRRVIVGVGFYNAAMVASGVVLLCALVPAPLLQMGSAPSEARRRGLIAAAVVGLAGFAASLMGGMEPAMAALAGGVLPAALCAVGARLASDAGKRSGTIGGRLAGALWDGRRAYCGFLAHVGLVGLIVGVAGSSLGGVQREFELTKGQEVRWGGRTIRFDGTERVQLVEKTVVAARLFVTDQGGRTVWLRPAQEYHRLQETWTTEAAVDRRISGDFYAVVRHGEGDAARFLLMWNPLVGWLWAGGWLMAVAGMMALAAGRVRREPIVRGGHARMTVKRRDREPRAAGGV